MRRVREVFAAFDAVHGRGAALREAIATMLLMAGFSIAACAVAAISGPMT